MFLRTLNVIIFSALITIITPSSAATLDDLIKETITLSSKQFLMRYNEIIQGSLLCEKFPQLTNYLKLPRKNALIETSSISKKFNTSSNASRLVRDAFLASGISNFLISKNSSFVDFFIGCPSAIIQSLICACCAANLLANNNKLGILVLIAGQNALQIEMMLYKILFMQPSNLLDDCTMRAVLSCLFRTWYPISALLTLDTNGKITENPITGNLAKKSLDDKIAAAFKYAERKALLFLYPSSNDKFPDDFFSTAETRNE